MEKRILLATDGRAEADGALRLARDLHDRKGWQIDVLAVVAPSAAWGVTGPYGFPDAYPYPTFDEEQIRRDVRDQFSRISGMTTPFDFAVEFGSPGPTIAQYASEHDCDYIVLGIGKRSAIDYWLRSETAQKVVRVASVPVLAADRAVGGLPARALVAVDFSTFSTEALRAAIDLLPAGGTLHLAHVAWELSEDRPEQPALSEWQVTYRTGLLARLQTLADEVQGNTQLAVEIHLLGGEVVPELLRLAGELKADLVAAGSHGYGFLGRALMGSVSSGLLRGAHGTVLLTPPTVAADELRQLPKLHTTLTVHHPRPAPMVI